MKKEFAKITMTFEEPVLGSASGNPRLHEDFIASQQLTKAPEAERSVAKVKEEVDVSKQSARSLVERMKPELLEQGVSPEEYEKEIDALTKATTVFPKDETGVFVWDYVVRGSFKECFAALIELGDITCLSKWSYKRAVDSFLFVHPRRIYMRDAQDKIITEVHEWLERPLRAETMRGERVALARSEMLPPGTRMIFDVMILIGENKKSKTASITMAMIREALDYGSMKGWGQWRGGGYGRYKFEMHQD